MRSWIKKICPQCRQKRGAPILYEPITTELEELARREEVYLCGDFADLSDRWNYHCYGCGHDWYDAAEYRERQVEKFHEYKRYMDL